jgi:hypothetical protein
LWAFPWTVSTIVIDTNQFAETVLKQAGFEGHIYQQDKDSVLDDGVRITSYIQTHLFAAKNKHVSHFGFIESRLEGIGQLGIFLYGINNVKIMTPPRWNLNPNASLYYQKPINFVAPKMSIKLICNLNAGDRFTLFDLSVDNKPMWAETPRL